MLRVTLIHILLFVLPFAAYALWFAITRRSAHAVNWRDAPTLTLSIVGGVIVIVSLIGLATFDGNPSPQGSYTPLQYRDGQLVPGHLD